MPIICGMETLSPDWRLRPEVLVICASSSISITTVKMSPRVAARLSPQPLHRGLDQRAARLDAVGHRLDRWPDALHRENERLSALGRALSGLDPARPKPGFARVEDADGRWITQAAGLSAGQAVNLVFPDGARGARIDGEGPTPVVTKPRPAPKPKPAPPDQGDLF